MVESFNSPVLILVGSNILELLLQVVLFADSEKNLVSFSGCSVCVAREQQE